MDTNQSKDQRYWGFPHNVSRSCMLFGLWHWLDLSDNLPPSPHVHLCLSLIYHQLKKRIIKIQTSKHSLLRINMCKRTITFHFSKESHKTTTFQTSNEFITKQLGYIAIKKNLLSTSPLTRFCKTALNYDQKEDTQKIIFHISFNETIQFFF